MSIKPAKIQFNGGELSPWLGARSDIAKYDKTAKLCRNFIPLTEGCLIRRGGTRFVAQTPVETGIKFSIVSHPLDAKVLINNVEQSSLAVASGDVVSYEVRADGYTTVSGKMTVTSSVTLNVYLVSLTEQRTLTVVAEPDDAMVKINGYEREQYTGALNEKVSYVVYKDGYQLRTGDEILDHDKIITINLVPEESDESSDDDITYGDWGNPVAFISCTAYGQMVPQKKCFLIRFENGYLPILFDAKKSAPAESDFDESLFIYETQNGYDTLAKDKYKVNRLAVIRRTSKAIYYDDLNGNIIVGFDLSTMKYYGWQLDENGYYASVYKLYDGYVVGKTVKVYLDGNLIWTMKGSYHG